MDKNNALPTQEASDVDEPLTYTQKVVLDNVIPYRGGTVVVPGKSNPSVPDHVWSILQQAGDIASQHLLNLLADKRFPALPVKEQARIIELALTRAYGSPDGAVRRNLHLHGKIGEDDDGDKGVNSMQELARKVHRRLPEFIDRDSPLEGSYTVSSDEDGDD